MNYNTTTNARFSFEGLTKREGLRVGKMLAHAALLSSLYTPFATVWAKTESFTADYVNLYAQPNTSAEVIGVFNASARITLTDDRNWEWVEVVANNGMRGFVRATQLTQHPKGAQTGTPEPFVPADSDYGSAHMVVNVAGLKARIQPASPKVACILTMGTAVGVDFIPVDGEAWVNIGSCGESQNAYVQRKFLGKHPDIQVIFKQYDRLPPSDIVMRKTLAERAVELAWQLDSSDKNIKPALMRFMSVARDLNDAQLIANTELSLLLHDSLSHRLSYEEQMAQTSSGKVKFGAYVAGMPVDYQGTPKLSKVKQTLGLPKQIKTDLEYCGDDVGDKSYLYPNATLYVDEKKGTTQLDSMRFAGDGNAFAFKATRFDKNTTEKEFIQQTHGWIGALPAQYPHEYWLSDGDWATHRFVFKDGYLFAYSFNVQC